ncbi:glycosyltransferase family 2 protein [Cellulomonas rhizosphaerae]|uniref:glycosyltransferase family 2 protein n=1 Tax=Cellulomonas rhizosphaerae TaxID=2293719 RepID=UPI001314B457|nr:glycosyltransferase family 2 protein [Cellulomonas rhizosphaerae]
MSRVTVAVLTFRRNDELAALLPMLIREVDAVAGDRFQADLLVVDNDPLGGARQVVDTQTDERVAYVCEPRPGIASARNRALREGGDAEVLVFIDDDERPEPHWLASLLALWSAGGATAVTGPVESRFEQPLDPWIVAGGFFRRAHTKGLESGQRLPAAATNNLLLDMAFVREHELEFETGLGLGGGEDTLFTRRLVEAGGVIVWCSEALVIDRVPADRTSRRFVLRRKYAQANVSVGAALAVAGRFRRPLLRGRYALPALARVIRGGLGVVVGALLRRPAVHARGAAALARGLGAGSAVLGVRFEEYRR